MKLAEILETVYGKVELHNGFDGKLVASTPKSLDKYKDVTVVGAYPKIKINERGGSDFAVPYLYVFGHNNDIQRIRKEAEENEN